MLGQTKRASLDIFLEVGDIELDDYELAVSATSELGGDKS